MNLVIRSAINAVSDLKAPGMLKLFFICMGITALGACLVFAVGFFLVNSHIAPMLPTEEEIPSGFLYSLFKFGFWMIASSVLILPVFLLFWSLMIFIASFFDEHIAGLIEKHRYPALAMGTPQPFWQEIKQDLWFMLKVTLINLVMIVVPIFWLFWWFLFPCVNGYLLGVYFFRMAGGRHIGRKAAGEVARKHRWEIFLGGLAIVLASGVPILNLAVPFWGVAMMVHLYHAVDKPAPAEILPPPAGSRGGDA